MLCNILKLIGVSCNINFHLDANEHLNPFEGEQNLIVVWKLACPARKRNIRSSFALSLSFQRWSPVFAMSKTQNRSS